MPRGYSLHIGLNHVDPDAYDGWDGRLFGCINDANAMKEICSQCHVRSRIDEVYSEAEATVQSTNGKVREVKEIVAELRQEGLLGNEPFATPLDFKYFDLWHYYGRTTKHGAFMGGADFAQWHGNYPLLEHTVEIKAIAEELRRQKDAANR